MLVFVSVFIMKPTQFSIRMLTFVVDVSVAIAVRRYTALSFDLHSCPGLELYMLSAELIKDPTISVASVWNPLPTNACSTSAAAWRLVQASVDPAPPDPEGSARSRRMNSSGSSSNCSVSWSRKSTLGNTTSLTREDMSFLDENSVLK